MTNVESPIFRIRGTPVTLDNIFSDFCKISLSKLRLITIKDNSQRRVWTTMDKPRKWLDKIADHYFIVRSPKGGIHFHALALMKSNNIRLFKGVHLNILPVGKVEREQRDFSEPYYEPHPCCENYDWGVCIMEVNKEVRMRFGGPKTSLPSRIKSKQYRQLRKLKVNNNVGRIINYLIKNANENLNPTPYNDFIYKRPIN